MPQYFLHRHVDRHHQTEHPNRIEVTYLFDSSNVVERGYVRERMAAARNTLHEYNDREWKVFAETFNGPPSEQVANHGATSRDPFVGITLVAKRIESKRAG